MYWYKPRALFVAALASGVFFIAGLQSCSKPAIKETGAKLTYFDVKGFFERDSARLAKLNPAVLKTVMHNGISETKKVHIPNWGTELSLFKSSDINKPAWKDSYIIEADSNIIIYRAKYPNLKTHEIMIKLRNGKVVWMEILNKTKNILFQSAEKLSYFPDSLYLIEKKQSVRLLGTNTYTVKGFFNQ